MQLLVNNEVVQSKERTVQLQVDENANGLGKQVRNIYNDIGLLDQVQIMMNTS